MIMQALDEIKANKEMRQIQLTTGYKDQDWAGKEMKARSEMRKVLFSNHGM